MNELLTSIATGVTAFAATNVDDIVVLTLFFTQVNYTFRLSQIVLGQYLGFSVLVLISLPGFFGGFLVPKPWIGLLGLLPILIGLSQLMPGNHLNAEIQGVAQLENAPGKAIYRWLNPQTYHVAAVTVANGADNVGIYTPLFASSDGNELVVLLGVFLILVGVWCLIGYRLARFPGIARLISHYGHRLFPFVLIGLGIFILLESGTLNLLRG